MPEPERTYQTSDRGLVYGEPIPTGYGHTVTAYTSSAAEGEWYWLAIDGTESPMEPKAMIAAHMSREQVAALVADLCELAGLGPCGWPDVRERLLTDEAVDAASWVETFQHGRCGSEMARAVLAAAIDHAEQEPGDVG